MKAFLGVVLLLAASGSVALPARAQVPPRQYEQSCTWFQNASTEQLAFRRAQMRQLPFSSGPDDAAVLRAVRAYLLSPDAPPRLVGITDATIAMRDYGSAAFPDTPKSGKDEQILLHAKLAGGVVWLGATLDPAGAIQSVWNVPSRDASKVYTFGRWMAAFMLLNDLMASDKTIPRRGCVLAVQDQLSLMPEVQMETARAFEAQPAQDETSLALVMAAYARYVRSAAKHAELGRALTMQTLSQLGNAPPIIFIYRDPGPALDPGTEIDVVRIGASLHTYAIATISGGAATIETWPLCIEGDDRCASYYIWP